MGCATGRRGGNDTRASDVGRSEDRHAEASGSGREAVREHAEFCQWVARAAQEHGAPFSAGTELYCTAGYPRVMDI